MKEFVEAGFILLSNQRSYKWLEAQSIPEAINESEVVIALWCDEYGVPEGGEVAFMLILAIDFGNVVMMELLCTFGDGEEESEDDRL